MKVLFLIYLTINICLSSDQHSDEITEEQFQMMKEKLDGIASRIEIKVNNLNKRMDDLADRIDGTTSKVKVNNHRLDLIRHQMRENIINDSLSVINKDQNAIDRRFQLAEDRISRLPSITPELIQNKHECKNRKSNKLKSFAKKVLSIFKN